MLFNSIEFLIFFAIVFTLYNISSHRFQNRLLLIASYIFYSCWDWRFLSLIIISTLADYGCALGMNASNKPTHRKAWLTVSLVVNLSMLGFFKYFNFFAENLYALLHHIGINLVPHTWHIVLPVGISFYTFQTLSYTIDVYRRTIKPTHNLLDFALYVAFFPQLVAGPIERAKHFLPQILTPRPRSWAQFYEGMFLIFWGLFEKVFISSNLAKIVDPIFSQPSHYQGGSTLIACYAFAFLIFCDFDAYSNIARGIGKCMGFDIINNFNLPYLATNPQEFWRRWHISLSSWLRDYLYIPLGGNRLSSLFTLRNLGLTMLLGGLWHGASWTFVAWGAYHGLLLIIFHSLTATQTFPSIKKSNNSFWWLLRVTFFFHLTTFGWLLFRAPNLTQAFSMLSTIITHFNFNATAQTLSIKMLAILTPLYLIQWGQWHTKDLLFLYKQHWVLKTCVYASLTYLTLRFGIMTSEEFIYFQF